MSKQLQEQLQRIHDAAQRAWSNGKPYDTILEDLLLGIRAVIQAAAKED